MVSHNKKLFPQLKQTSSTKDDAVLYGGIVKASLFEFLADNKIVSVELYVQHSIDWPK